MEPKKIKIAVVISRFNEEITQAMLEGAYLCADQQGLKSDQMEVVWVPGAFELPLIAKKMAQTKYYDAVVCLGAVLQGETKHFDYVSTAVTHGLTQVALEQKLPILFGILTCDYSQAIFRTQGENNKGYHTFKAALEMIDVCEQISQKEQNFLQ